VVAEYLKGATVQSIRAEVWHAEPVGDTTDGSRSTRSGKQLTAKETRVAGSKQRRKMSMADVKRLRKELEGGPARPTNFLER